MNKEIFPELRTQLTLPMTVLEKLVKGEEVSPKTLALAREELEKACELLEQAEEPQI